MLAALQAVTSDLNAWEFPAACGGVRVDGHYGDRSVIAQIVASGVQIVVRKRGSRALHHPLVQAASAHDPVARSTTRECQVTYEVFDLPHRLLEDGKTVVRLVLTRRAWKRGDPIVVRKELGEWVYEQFVTTLPPDRLLATDGLARSQGRGAFEGTLADDDWEGDPDRWCSLTPRGQEVWQIVWQGVWTLRLAFAVSNTQAPLREMEWAPPPLQTGAAQPLAEPARGEESTYGPLT